MMNLGDPVCVKCGKKPHQILEYTATSGAWGPGEYHSPADYVRDQEGTYNPDNGHFFCTACYVEAGMPLGKAP